MNLTSLLHARAESGRPVRAALIGAGKFGSMFLAQVPTIPGLEVAAIADLDPDRARQACRAVGWDDTRLTATRFMDSGRDACAAEDVEVVIEATGSPEAGIAHALAAIEQAKHIVMSSSPWTPAKASSTGPSFWPSTPLARCPSSLIGRPEQRSSTPTRSFSIWPRRQASSCPRTALRPGVSFCPGSCSWPPVWAHSQARRCTSGTLRPSSCPMR